MVIYFKKKPEKGLKTYMSLDKLPEVRGYDFSGKFNFDKFMDSFLSSGFQASNLGRAKNILEVMLEEKKKGLQIWMSFTGNMISSGNREIITFLVKNKIIDGITTSAAAIEEDIIKCIKPFYVGNFDVAGSFLHAECIGRIGNILAPYDRYLYLERFLTDLFKKMQKEKKISSTFEISKKIGNLIAKHSLTKDKHEESFLYWAAKNKIPVFCPAITDGAFGDMTVFFKRNNPSFMIDVTKDHTEITKLLQNAEKTASIILGGGVAKHYLLNAAIFREGMEYSIYLTTANEFDGSDSGGNQEEAISWAKLKPSSQRVKVVGDATILFPMLIASVFHKNKFKTR